MLEAVSANHYRIQGDIGMQSSSLLLRELLALPNANKNCDVYVDVSTLTFADSLLLAALLNLQRQQQKQQQKPQTKMNQKEAEQRLKLLEQKEKDVQERLQKEKSKTGGGQPKDW